jgi:hypothetical protein
MAQLVHQVQKVPLDLQARLARLDLQDLKDLLDLLDPQDRLVVPRDRLDQSDQKDLLGLQDHLAQQVLQDPQDQLDPKDLKAPPEYHKIFDAPCQKPSNKK